MQPFDPTREVIKLKFESDRDNPFQEVAHQTSEFAIRILDMKLHNNSNPDQQGEIGKFDILLKIKSGEVTKTVEKYFIKKNSGTDDEVCKKYNTFKSITDQRRLPEELLVDLLGDPILTAEGTEQGQCSTENLPDWSNFINSGNIKFVNAAFTDYNGEKIVMMGWRSYWKIIVRTGLW